MVRRPPLLLLSVAVLATVDGQLVPYVPDRPHRLTMTAMVAYVNKTFGPTQRCLKVMTDDTAVAAAILAMLYDRVTATRTVELLDELSGPDDRTSYCAAYVVIGCQLTTIDRYLERFKNSAAQRMLIVVVQSRKYIKPFLKVRLLYNKYTIF
ncbi:Hypothetical protein CINCED_3A000797 [Cinara cedri]|uniref:Uncharacterized protein n=1 Tax=Cinara cedri TaxID=506608 RepID=A0A5E4NGK0_9HEMI|nr:Hypothetical protein CINCED_3A000797 [Cinara cedri]